MSWNYKSQNAAKEVSDGSLPIFVKIAVTFVRLSIFFQGGAKPSWDVRPVSASVAFVVLCDACVFTNCIRIAVEEEEKTRTANLRYTNSLSVGSGCVINAKFVSNKAWSTYVRVHRGESCSQRNTMCTWNLTPGNSWAVLPLFELVNYILCL